MTDTLRPAEGRPYHKRPHDPPNNIYAWRLERGLTLAALAARVGCTAGAIACCERGTRDPSLSLLRSLAAALGVTVGQLLEGPAPEQESTRPGRRKERGGFPSFIREWRKARGMTLRETAEAVGCSAPHLSQVETGNAGLTVDTLRKIAKAIDVDPAWLLSLDPKEVLEN